jgi:hypothetical protein
LAALSKAFSVFSSVQDLSVFDVSHGVRFGHGADDYAVYWPMGDSEAA